MCRQVTVGLRHAALVTHSGEVYTWGNGAGGKLGLGHAVDACAPQRVHTLWGQRIKSIVAGGKALITLHLLSGRFILPE
jgi:alpha-tubulin suppressor-like RCC1 family protein